MTLKKQSILIRRIKIFLRDTYMRIYALSHGITNAILFDSFMGNQYSDSQRAISETLHDLYPEYRLIWHILPEKLDSCTKILPDYVEVVSNKWDYYRAKATSFCFVTNEGTSDRFKRNGQFFIGTWHGDRGFKKILYWSNRKLSIPLTDDSVNDICVAGSAFGAEMYRGAFHYNGEIIQAGMPRNDRLVQNDPDDIRRTKSLVGIVPQKKVLLYAPTFRDAQKGRQQAVTVDLRGVMDALQSKTGSEWVCLVRAHPTKREGLDIACNGEQYLDVSSYPDMTDLLLIADMLITDYSSSAGDYVLLNRPVILAIFDLEEYEANSRQLVEPIENTGFLIAKNQEQLEHMIMTLNADEYEESCRKVMEHYGITESGESARIICTRIHEFYQSHHQEVSHR